MSRERTVSGHRIGDVVVIDLPSWHRSRNASEHFKIAAFETVKGELWARLVPVYGDGYYRCPVREIAP